MFTGLSSAQHNITNNGTTLKQGNTIFEKLSNKYNYNTGVFSSNGFLVKKDVGLRDCFEIIVSGSEEDMTTNTYKNKYRLETSPDGFWYTNKLLKFIDNQDDNWAACLNIMDAHHPYEPKKEYDCWSNEEDWCLQNKIPLTSHWKWKYYSKQRDLSELERLRSLYYGSIRQVDAVVEYLFDELKNRKQLDDTCVVICADHGDGFGEKSYVDTGVKSICHGIGLHERLLHIPLIVVSPDSDGNVISKLSCIDKFAKFSEKVVNDDKNKEKCFIESNRLNIFAENYENCEMNKSQISNYNLSEVNLEDGYVSYNQNGNKIEKILKWGDKSVKITFEDNVVHITNNESDIDYIFNQIKQVNIKKYYEKDDINESTKQRLKDLGYL